MTKVNFDVEGMSCGHCKQSIEEALLDLEGVGSAEVDLEADTVTIEYNDTKVESAELTETISQAGPYQVV